jgi:NADH dehydrogenase
MSTGTAEPHRVVIVGGGFAGLHAALHLARANVEVTLIDRRNFHLFQPLLYQVATGSLSPANIAAPLRSILRRQANVRVMLGEVIDLDPVQRRVLLARTEFRYDTLIVATGATHHYFGNPGWEAHAPGLKTVEDATRMRARILLAFERAEQEADGAAREALLTFVIVGAGPTGVELAGALAEIAGTTLRGEFRAIDPARARVLLVEGADRVLPGYPPVLSRKAEASLVRLGVEVWTGCQVTQIAPDTVTVDRAGTSQRIPTRTVLWAAGVKASPLGQVLAERAGARLDRAGRVVVTAQLTLSAHPEILILGDLACAEQPDGQPLPGVAQVAMQQGEYAARSLRRRLAGRSVDDFRYRDFGSMATIGKRAAVAELFGLRLAGYPAWLIWLFIHLMNLVQFENRLLVLVQWAWNYWSDRRSARLITGS